MAGFVRSVAVRWNSVATAPNDRQVQVQVADNFGDYPLPFLCKLTDAGWVRVDTNEPLALTPTGWREPRGFPGPKRTAFVRPQARAGSRA